MTHWEPYQWAQIVQLAGLVLSGQRAADRMPAGTARRDQLAIVSRCARNVRAWAHIAEHKLSLSR